MATVRDVGSKVLVTVTPTETLAEAATVMGEHRVGSALVLDGEALIGILTERDILRALASDADGARHPVRQWMTPDPATVEPETPADEALRRMLKGGFRHLPVVEGGRVVGMVSIRDLTRAAIAEG